MPTRTQALVAATSLACLIAWSAPVIYADDASTPKLVNQGVSEQKNIRSQTQRAAEELDALVLEFNRNGLGDGADVQILKAIRNVLATLSDKDMQKVITLLESAKQGDAHSITRSLADAFTAQKGISVQFHQLLIEYQREQDLADIALRLTRLADTENENMKAGIGLYRSSKGVPPRNYNDIQKAQLQVQHSQQQAIYDEARILIDRLGELAQAGTDATATSHLKAVVDAAADQKVAATLRDATDELKAANLFSAVGKERVARDVLRDLARLAAPTKDPIDALKDAADQLAQSIRQENFVAKESRKVTQPDKDDVDAAAQIDDQQADIVDATDQVKKDIANLTPEAVPDLNQAHDQMQESRKSVTEGKGQDASEKAATASKQLTAARDKVLAEIQRLQDAMNADTKIAEEKALREQIVALRHREEQLQTDTGMTRETKLLADLAPRQGTLILTAQDLQKTAAAILQTVADAIGDAAKGMGDAQTALAARQNGPEAVRNEQLAVDALKKAEQLLDADIARLEKTKEQLAKLEKAREKVAKAVEQQTKVELNTNKLAQLDNKKPDAALPTPKDLAPQQDQVGKDAKDAAKDVADAAPDATKPLNDAAKNAQDAKAALDKPDPKAADPDAKKALNNLQKGLDAIDKQIAKDKQDLGEPDDTQDKLADADQAIDKALDDLDAADQDPVSQIKAKQQEIANDLKKMDQKPADVTDAQKAAAQAAADLDKTDLPKAAQDMQKAEDAMEKAMDAGDKPDAQKPDGQQPDAAKPDGQTPKSALPELAKKQADLQKQLADLQAGEPPPSDEGVATDLSQATADDASALPDDANAAMAEAQSDSSDAAAQQAAGKPNGQSKAQAKAALARAKASVAMAKAGLGQGKELAKGQEPGQTPGEEPGMGKEDPNSKGKGDRKDANAGRDSRTGGVARDGQAAYVGLPPRDRDAIRQSRSEKYPEEYGPMIEQYLKNLSDETSK